MRTPKNNLLKKLQQPIVSQNSTGLRDNFDLSRREFLKNTGRIGFGAALSGLVPEYVYSSNLHPDIAIIGAGIAGLNAADYLKKAGIKAWLFEADPKRAGGRIFTDRGQIVPGLTAELGGEFIDSSHSEIFRLMADFNLRPKDVTGDRLYFKDMQECYVIGNRLYSERQVAEAFSPYRDLIAGHLKSCGDGFNTPMARQLDNLPLSAYLTVELKMDGWLKTLLSSAFCAEYGMDPDRQSALNLISMIGTDAEAGFKMFGASDEVINIDGGNDLLVKALAESLAEQISYGHQLLAIRQKGNKYALAFNNGREKLFDLVILCIPFSVLRNIDLEKSGLSGRKRDIIGRLGYGTNSKVIMGLTKRIWREQYQATGYVFNEVIYNGWDASRMQANNTGPSIFTCLIGGQAGREVADRHTDYRFLEEKYTDQLDRIYPGSKAAHLQNNKSPLVADWPNQTGFNGSYACYLPGQWTDFHAEEGTPENNIYFAGEHCSQQFQGFMNGAAETGRSAALSIIRKIV